MGGRRWQRDRQMERGLCGSRPHLAEASTPRRAFWSTRLFDLERMADIVVECAQSQAPSDFDHDEGDVLTEATSGARANAVVFRVLLLRAFELILADPAHERVLRASFEPSRSENGGIRYSDKSGDQPQKRDSEARRADLGPSPPQTAVPPEPTNSMPPHHEYRPTGQPSGGAILRRAVREAAMRGSRSDRAAAEYRPHPPPADREQQPWPPPSSGGVRAHAKPEQDHERSKLTAPPRSSIRSLTRWLVVILTLGAALAAWIYREEVGAVAADLLDLFRPH